MNETSETRREDGGEEIIYAYTREQAIEDGELVDITPLAREAGFKYPVAVTRAVWDILEPAEELKAAGQDVTGRTWDMLQVLRWAMRRSGISDRIAFAPLFLTAAKGQIEPVSLWAVCGPGDDGQAVITIMTEGED
jgi:DNA topoisomerase IB